MSTPPKRKSDCLTTNRFFHAATERSSKKTSLDTANYIQEQHCIASFSENNFAARIHTLLTNRTHQSKLQEPARRRTPRHSLRMCKSSFARKPSHPKRHRFPRSAQWSTNPASSCTNRRSNPTRYSHRRTNMDLHTQKNPLWETASRRISRQDKLRSTDQDQSAGR